MRVLVWMWGVSVVEFGLLDVCDWYFVSVYGCLCLWDELCWWWFFSDKIVVVLGFGGFDCVKGWLFMFCLVLLV